MSDVILDNPSGKVAKMPASCYIPEGFEKGQTQKKSFEAYVKWEHA